MNAIKKYGMCLPSRQKKASGYKQGLSWTICFGGLTMAGTTTKKIYVCLRDKSRWIPALGRNDARGLGRRPRTGDFRGDIEREVFGCGYGFGCA